MHNPIRLPNALVIGGKRSGSTSLHHYLKQHSDIFLPQQKELHYFSYPHLTERTNGPGDLASLASLCASREEYEAHYAHVGAEKIVAEVSPSYLYFSQVSERIFAELGQVKIIVLLRNPIEKAFSQYMHLGLRNRETLQFYDALMAEEQRRASGWNDMWCYAESCLYAERIKIYLSVFGTENVKFILSEQLFSSAQTTMCDLYTFLNVDAEFQPNTSTAHGRSGVPRTKWMVDLLTQSSMPKTIVKAMIPAKIRFFLRHTLWDLNVKKKEIDEQSRTYLTTYFQNDIMEVEAIIGQQTDWLN